MNKLVEVKNMSITFKRKTALKSVNCYLNRGEVVGLVGPNGAGKTTLMKAMIGFIPISKGEIQQVKETTIEALIEQPGLYPFLSGWDHLQLFAEVQHTAAIDRLISLLDMNEFIGKKTKEYSLGMKQRLTKNMQIDHACIRLDFINDMTEFIDGHKMLRPFILDTE